MVGLLRPGEALQRLAEQGCRIIPVKVHEHGPYLVRAVTEAAEGLLNL